MRIPRGGIAFFDSGIGGLTVLAECEKYCKEEIYYYFGDNVHAPYGNLPPEKIRKYVLKAFRLFNRLRVKAVVIACNTATAVCIEELRKKYSFPIIGAEPAIFSAVKQGGEIFVLATRATCESERLRSLCQKYAERYPNVKITICPCERLAEAIEKSYPYFDLELGELLPQGNPKGVVLGCTHYIYIKEKISDFYKCNAYDGNEGIAKRLKCVLEKNLSKNRDEQPPTNVFKIKHKTKSFFIKKLAQKTNVRSDKTIEKRAKCSVFFLGKQRKINETVYKQMFV